MTVISKTTVTLLAIASSVMLAAQAPSVQPASAAPKTVALDPGVCAQVSEGDIVTLEWNPAFDSSVAVSNLRNFQLTFARRGEEEFVRRSHGGLVLNAIQDRGEAAPLNPAISDAHNGFFKFNFRVKLQSVEPGEYYLLQAQAALRVVPEGNGEPPKMLNSPAGSPFCLNVAPGPPGRFRVE